MSVDIQLSFGKFLRLSMVEYRRQCGGELSAQMAEEQIDRCHNAWHAARAQKEKAKRTVFLPPTPEEVERYSQEIGYPLDGTGWCLFYEQKGWKTGSAKMANWRAAVRNWKRNGWRTKITPRSTGPDPSLAEPQGWTGFMLSKYPDWVEFKDGAVPTWERLDPETKKTVRKLMEDDAL